MNAADAVAPDHCSTSRASFGEITAFLEGEEAELLEHGELEDELEDRAAGSCCAASSRTTSCCEANERSASSEWSTPRGTHTEASSVATCARSPVSSARWRSPV